MRSRASRLAKRAKEVWTMPSLLEKVPPTGMSEIGV